MRNLLALIGLVVVLVAGGGWYLGWYKLGSEPADDGHRKINVDVNTEKINDDLKKSKETVGGILTHDQSGTGQNASTQKKSQLNYGIVPTVGVLPKLPEAPAPSSTELVPSGLPTLIPPPPAFPGNKQ